jgi:3-keto-disaccharide hydrolase
MSSIETSRSCLPCDYFLRSRMGTFIAVVMMHGLFTLPGYAQQQPDREALKKVTPTISGQRNGIDLEPDSMDFEDHAGFVPLFDGKSLANWDGRPGVWRVENGVIVGVSTLEEKSGSTFLVNRGLTSRDFDLKLEVKVENGGGSGIQYRSSTGIPPGRVPRQGEPPLDPRWVMIGPEADFSYPASKDDKDYSGQVYSQNTGRGILAWRGQVVEVVPSNFPRLIGAIGDRSKLGSVIHDGWNQYEIVARGGVILHILNGQLMAVLIDDEPTSTNNISGLIGLQILGAPCKVSFRNIWLRRLN